MPISVRAFDGLPVSHAWVPPMAAAAADCAATESTQTTAKSAYDASHASVASQRPGVDRFIKDIWDTIE